MVTIHMPKAVLNVNLTATQGNYTYDLTTKVTNRLQGCRKQLYSRYALNERLEHLLLLNVGPFYPISSHDTAQFQMRHYSTALYFLPAFFI